jgi:uncharacterized protein involved in tolerance to divalent cations
MQATITNVAREKERIIVFVSFSDGTEKVYFYQPEVSEKEITAEIKTTLTEKAELLEKTTSLASRLVNQVITLGK